MAITTELTRELAALEELVVDFVLNPSGRQQYRQGNVAKKELAPYVELISAMSKRYVGVEAIKLNKQQVDAYALYYLPVNYAKIAFLLGMLNFAAEKTIRILDFGCGPGTAALASVKRFLQPVDITLSDASPDCLAFAAKLLTSYRSKDLKLNSYTTLPTSENSFDLVMAANVISEISGKESEELLQLLVKQVDSRGYLVLLVPALKATTQHLMAIRDKILKQFPEFSVIFPCSIQSPCPMRAEARDDWCHGELQHASWDRSSLLRQLDEMLAFNKHRVKYAAIVFQRCAVNDNDDLVILRPGSKSHPALLCGNNGLVRIDLRKIKNSLAKRALKNGNSFERLKIDSLS